MPVSTTHPLYDHRVVDWELCRDCVEGQAAIYRRLLRYLPPPPGLVTGGGSSLNNFLTKRYTGDRYTFYASFAEFPEIVAPTLNAIMGLIHEKLPKIELPPELSYLNDKATPDGENLQELWERVTKEIIITGRWVGLGEIVDGQLLACSYAAESLINWRLEPKSLGGKPLMVVLRECNLVGGSNDPYIQTEQITYRVLSIDQETGAYSVKIFMDGSGGLTGVPIDEDNLEVYPTLFGDQFDHIPIYPINALDVTFDYGPMPMLGLSRRAASIFRKSADYHRSLYYKGDPQPVIMGVDPADAPTEIGGGKLWVFTNPDSKVQYLDIDGQGIPLMAAAINDQYAKFADEAGMMFEGVATGYESGEALRRRQAMRQVTVKNIVINAAHGMEVMLRDFAKIRGADPKAVVFEPNLDFSEPLMQGQELFNILQAKVLGAPISNESIHDVMRRRQLVKSDFESEMNLIKTETKLYTPPTPGQTQTSTGGGSAK